MAKTIQPAFVNINRPDIEECMVIYEGIPLMPHIKGVLTMIFRQVQQICSLGGNFGNRLSSCASPVPTDFLDLEPGVGW